MMDGERDNTFLSEFGVGGGGTKVILLLSQSLQRQNHRFSESLSLSRSQP
jgi:hypothetical protein